MNSRHSSFVFSMDDWIIIAATRWKLRKAIWRVNQTLNELRVEHHPNKTLIGRSERGGGRFFRVFFETWGGESIDRDPQEMCCKDCPAL
jgi:hypothetical protein